MAPKPSDRRAQLIRTAGDSSALLRVPVRDSHKATVQSAKIEISLEKKLQKEKKIKENKNQMHLAVKEYDLVGILVGSWHSVRTDWSL